MAHYGLWRALFQEGANVLFLSRGENEAAETLDYCRFIHSQLPDFLQISRGKDQASLLTFPVMNSRIRALPATEVAGIGLGGATLIISDEFDFHPYASENYAEIKPMIDAGEGRQYILLSARNVASIDSKFKQIYLDAKQKLNNFYPVFFPYNVLEYRTEEWYQDRTKEYDDWDMATRYPRSEEEALSPPKALSRFDADSVAGLISDAKNWSPKLERNGLVRIYKESVAGQKCCFAIDSSEGEYDPSCGVVIDWRTNEELANFHGFIPVDEQAVIIFDLWERYNKPFISVERNADGIRLIEKLVNMGIEERHWYKTSKEKLGWWTSGFRGGYGNRPVLIGELAEAIIKRQFPLHYAEGLLQFQSFIRTKKKPEGEATKGTHDDYVMACGQVLQIKRSMPVGQGRFMTFDYRRK